MFGLRAAEGLILRTAGRLVADQVGPRAADTRRTDRLVGVDHDMIVGRLLQRILVVVDHPLTVVVLAAGDDAAHVARLHGVVAVVAHEPIGPVEVTLVVAHRGRGLVVHDDLHPFVRRVAVQLLDVEIGIRGHEIEDVILRLAEPVLPAFVPALDQHGVEPVFGGEVDVLLHVFGRGSVAAVRTEFRVVRDT